MGSNNETEETWRNYIGEKLALTLDAVQTTAAATIEYGKEKLVTPEVTEKMCFEFSSGKTKTVKDLKSFFIKSKFLWEIGIFAKNPNFCLNSNCLSKIGILII